MAPTASEVLLGAATDGNLRLLKKMARKVNLREATGFKGRNALHRAAAAGRLEICRFLIEEAGFDANSPSGEGETPMLLAVEYEEGKGNVHVLRYLLDHGGDPARPDSRGYTPLHNAAEFGHCEAVELLLSKGVPLDPINDRGTPLHLAAAKGHDQVVKILLEHGADPNRVIKNVLPPLVMACYGQFLKCMKLLVQAGADVNVKSPTGQPVLMSAIDEGSTDIAIFLLETGADPNIDDGDGRFPIMAAAEHEQRELVEILFPRTKQIPSLPDWSVDGIIRTMKYKRSEAQEEDCATYWKMRGNKQFVKGDYVAAVHMYSMQVGLHPLCPQPGEISFDAWWERINEAANGLLLDGINSLIILGAWVIWNHRNRCVFDGHAPNVTGAMAKAVEERRLWMMAGARGLSLLTAPHPAD